MPRDKSHIVSFHVDKASIKRTLQTMANMSVAQSEKKSTQILRSSVKPIEADMKMNAPTADNDNVLRNIGITTARKRTKNSGGVRVGVVKDNVINLPNFSAPALAGSIEYGTVERRTKTGKATGMIDPSPFLRPAYDRHIDSVINSIESKIEREIMKALK